MREELYRKNSVSMYLLQLFNINLNPGFSNFPSSYR